MILDLYGYLCGLQDMVWRDVFVYLDAHEEVEFSDAQSMYYTCMDEAHAHISVALRYVESDNYGATSDKLQSACESLASAAMYAKKDGDTGAMEFAYICWRIADEADDFIVGT